MPPLRLLAYWFAAALAAFGPAQAQLPANAGQKTGAERPAYLNQQNVAAYADWQLTMQRMHLALPAPLPPPATDPGRPAGTFQKAGSSNWVDSAGYTYVRSVWGHWSNYKEKSAGGFPAQPAVLALANGRPVRNAKAWWQQRRPEIVQLYEQNVYGRVPLDAPAVRFEMVSAKAGVLNGKAIRRDVVGHLDNRSFPAATPRVAFSIYTPAQATGPMPLIVIVWGSLPAPTAILEQVLAAGWAVALFDTGALQQDSGAGLGRGIIGLVGRGQPRRPADWGVLVAWSWGLSRALDFLEKDPAIDPRRIGIEGHSRWGKTALLAGALDPRWALVWASSAGAMGTSLEKRNYGETIDDVAGSGEYHWMAPNFLRYGGHWADLPVDAHELLALVAPRPLLVTGGTQGESWVDPRGEFLACVAASPVYELLGKKGLGTSTMPAPNQALMAGELAFRYHEGGHTDAPDWPAFLAWARRYWEPRAARK